MADGDRSRKSWREIDKQRDGSAHRRADGGGQTSRRSSQRSNKSYRSALDRLFDSGKIGDLVAEQSERGSAESASSGSRPRLLRAIHQAQDRDQLTKAFDAFLAAHELPADADVVARLLEHRDPSRQRQAIEVLLDLPDGEAPKHIRAVIGQLKLLRDTSDDDDVVELARRLLDRYA